MSQASAQHGVCSNGEYACEARKVSPAPPHELMEYVMKDVYGDWGVEDWEPKPLPLEEAGPSPSGQRRYLWADAFGVLNFVTLAKANAEKKEEYLGAAYRLIVAVHTCLGNPRDDRFPMLEAEDGGYSGLRIGKLEAKKVSDAGMEYDGMYWHYLDKWLFALARYAVAAENRDIVERGFQIVRQVHPRFLARESDGKPKGLYWKMNVDLSTVPGRDRTGPNNDAVGGLVAYTALECAGASLGVESSLEHEIADLTSVVKQYSQIGGFAHGSSDPLGFGLQIWAAQFVPQEFAESLLLELRSLGTAAIDIRHSGLPFRLYGAIIGAKLSGDVTLNEKAETLMPRLSEMEMRSTCGEVEHSGINKVMFATALDPLAFRRQDYETRIRF